MAQRGHGRSSGLEDVGHVMRFGDVVGYSKRLEDVVGSKSDWRLLCATSSGLEVDSPKSGEDVVGTSALFGGCCVI